jgi:hypothetical protein
MFARRVGSARTATILERIAESSAATAACERSACSAARWLARPRTPRRSPTARAGFMINVAAIYDPSSSEPSEHAA